MMDGLGLVTLRQWQQHKLRLALTIVGVALGVAVFFAVRSTTQTLVDSLNSTIEKLAGKATLQVAAGDAGFSNEYLKVVRETPGVALAEPVTESIVETVTPAGEKMLVLGLDIGSKLELYSEMFEEGDLVVSNPLAFSSRVDSIAVTRKFAERFGIQEGDKLSLLTQSGRKDLTVRGFFKSEGGGEVYDGNVAVMDIFAARETFGKGVRIDRIDLTNAPGVEVDKLAEDLRAQLPPGIRVERPSLRGQALENTVSTMHFGLTIMSFLALTICVFLIFNSFSISLNQRWKEIGILRAIGVKRQGVRMMFLGEAVLLGLIGSAIGILGGYFLAKLAIGVVTRVTTTVYGVVTVPQALEFDTQFALEAFAVGMIASLLAAWLPARAASRLRPVLALTNIETRQSEQGLNKVRIAAGVVLVILGVLLIRFTRPEIGMNVQLFYSVLMQIGMILLLPMFILLGARVIRRAMGWLFGVEGMIAVESMAGSPRRTVATVGAIMIGLSFVIAHAAFIQSQKAALDRSLDKTLSSDILISSSEQINGRSYHFSEDIAAQVAAMPETEIAAPMRVTSISYGGEDISLSAHDMDKYFASSPDLLDFGDPAYARAATARGEGALISTNLSMRTGLGLGGRIKIDSPNGTFELPVVGMLDYFRSQKGTVFIDRALYKKYWNDPSVDYVFIDLKPGVDRAAFKQKLQNALSGQHAFVYTHDEFKAWVTRLVDQFFTLTYLQMVIAVFVAAIGLVNTMVISVAERRRELGIFRAVGGLRRQVAKMVMLEAVSIGLIGLFTGAIMGLLSAYFLVNTAAKVVAGFTVSLIFPYWIMLVAIPIVLIVAAAAAFVPSFNASRIHIAEAIGYE